MVPTTLPQGVSQQQLQTAVNQMQQLFQQAAQTGAMPTMVPGGPL